LAATEYPTDPLPEPEVPEVIVIHPTLLRAVHAQPVRAVTGTDPAETPAPTLALDGLNGETQPVVKDQTLDVVAPALFLAPTAQ
jgi:hypothetical protein